MKEASSFFLSSNTRIRLFAILALALVALTIIFWWLNPAQRYYMTSQGAFHYLLLQPLKLIASVTGIAFCLGTLCALVVWRVKMPKGQLILRSSVFLCLPVALVFCLPAAYGVLRSITHPAQRLEVIVRLEESEPQRDKKDKRNHRVAGTPEEQEEQDEADMRRFLRLFEAKLYKYNGWVEDVERLENRRVRMIVVGNVNDETIYHLTEKGDLGFYETPEFMEGFDLLEEIDKAILHLIHEGKLPITKAMRQLGVKEEPDPVASGEVIDTGETDYLHPKEEEVEDEDSLSLDERHLQFEAEHPVLGLMTIQPADQINSLHPLMGYVKEENREQLALYLNHPDVKGLYRSNVRFMFCANPADIFSPEADPHYELIAIKEERDGGPALSGEYVSEARRDHEYYSGQPSISLRFNKEGSEIWARLTRNNKDHCIAITMDEVVYSYPNVQGVITGGNSQITGNFTEESADELVSVIKTGAYFVKPVVESIRKVGGEE